MAFHTIMIPSAVMAKNIDSLVRSAVSTADLDNGALIQLNTGVSANYGEDELYTATTPATGSLSGLWMVGEPEVDVTDGKYKGIDVNPRDFYNIAGTPFTAFKPKMFDIVRLTDESFTNTRGTKTYASAADSTNDLTWVTSPTANATSFRLIATTYVSVPQGKPGSGNRITIYRLECVTE